MICMYEKTWSESLLRIDYNVWGMAVKLSGIYGLSTC